MFYFRKNISLLKCIYFYKCIVKLIIIGIIYKRSYITYIDGKQTNLNLKITRTKQKNYT